MTEQQLDTNQGTPASLSGTEFDILVERCHQTFNERMALYGPHLFATREKGLSTIYRKAFPEAEQQHHNCTCCRTFILRFGHLVFITPEGKTIPAIWESETVPEEYRASVKAVEAVVRKNGVIGQFWTEHNEWGQGSSGGWTHFYLPTESVKGSICPSVNLATNRGVSATNFDLVTKAVEGFSVESVRVVLNELQAAGKICGKFIPPLEWLYAVLKGAAGKTGSDLRNYIFLETAKTSNSFAATANNAVGTLLEEINAGRPVNNAMRTFIQRTDPEFYRQPIAAPTDGNVAVAVKRFEELGLSAKDLGRRLARLDELRSHWTPPVPVAEEPVEAPLFGNIKTKQSVEKPTFENHIASSRTMSWEVFKAKVLPQVTKLEVMINAQEHFVTFTAPSDPEAGKLFFYDTDEDRNPLGWYTTKNPQSSSDYRLTYGRYAEVAAISDIPSAWTGGPRGLNYSGDVLMLPNLTEQRTQIDLALFPELLRGELREVERVIAAHSNSHYIDTNVINPAIGLSTNKPRHIRVTTELGQADYYIDRPE